MTPRKIVPYLIALFIAGMIIAGAWLFVGWTHKGMQQRFETYKKGLLAMNKAGTLPAEWQGQDIEKLEASQVQMQIPPEAQAYWDVADFLSNQALWLITGVVMLCLAVAFMVDRKITDSPLPTASPAGRAR
jgi:hypothetical protein